MNKDGDQLATRAKFLKKKIKRKEPSTKFRRLKKNKRLYTGLKNKLKKILPAVFKKDEDRGNYLFHLLCDIIRINHLIDTFDDIGSSIDFIMTEQRILHAMHNLFSIRKPYPTNEIRSTTRSLGSYMPLYQEHFKEICQLGSGSYGKVYKAQHRLDETMYAVKKIAMKADKIEKIEQSIEEVKTLAKLNHFNIVSYNYAWIEESTEHLTRSEFSSGVWTESPSDVSNIISETEDGSKFLKSINRDFQFFNIISNHKDSLIKEEDSDDEESLEKESKPIMILYIQMNLCEKNLEEWINERIGFSEVAIIEKIAIQILNGLDYVHKLGVVHHDLNPKNIFISTKYDKIHVQIGDFGLACLIKKTAHSQIIGTRRYIAPEQLEKTCDSKSDIYSFGLVLFELLYPMQTVSEWMKEVASLKEGIIPNIMQKKYPQWTEIVIKTIEKNPAIRPSAEEILETINIDKAFKIVQKQKLQDKYNSFKDDEYVRLFEKIIELRTKMKKKEEMLKSSSSIEDLNISQTNNSDECHLDS